MHPFRWNNERSYRAYGFQTLHSARSLTLDPQALLCGLWDLGEEDIGRGPDLPNHTTFGSDQSHSSQQQQSHQGSQHPEH